MRRTGLLTLTLLCGLPAWADAHVRLIAPVPRTPSDGIKNGPCGPFPPGSGRRTELVAGSRLTVQFEETIDHPGHFRVAWSARGDDDFDAHVLADDIPVRRDDRSPHQYAVEVVVPAAPCAECSLQLIQYMLENPNRPSLYFSCADIRIVAPPEPDAAVPVDAAPSPDAATPRDAAAPAPDAAPPAPDLSVGPGPDDPDARPALDAAAPASPDAARPDPVVDAAEDTADAADAAGSAGDGGDDGGCQQAAAPMLGAPAIVALLLQRRRRRPRT